MKRIKLIAILSVLGLVGIVVSSSHQFSSKAENDEVLTEIAKYKTWKQIHKSDEKIANGTFKVFDSSVAG